MSAASAFNKEVVRCICSLRLLEQSWNDFHCYGHDYWKLEYLIYMMNPGHAGRHKLTRAITASVNWIIAEQPQLEPRKAEFLHALCFQAVQTNNPVLPVYYYLGYSHIFGSEHWSTDCAADSLENKLAAVVYLGISPLVQPLLDELNRTPSIGLRWPLNNAIAGGQHELVNHLMDQGYTWHEDLYPVLPPRNCSAILTSIINRHPQDTGMVRRSILRATASGDDTAVLEFMQYLEHPSTDFYTAGQHGAEYYTPALYSQMLYVAAYHGHEGLVQYAIKHGAAPNYIRGYRLRTIRGLITSEKQRYTPLEVAASKGHINIVRYLLDTGGKATSKALGAAARAGWLQIAQLLIDASVCVFPCPFEPNDSGSATFLEVVRRGHMDMVRLFLENGYDVTDSRSEEDAGTAFEIALERGMTTIMSLLYEHGFWNRWALERSGLQFPDLAWAVKSSRPQ